MGFDLRDYQRNSLDALLAYWGNGGGNGLIVLPTGAGKSLVLAAICREILRDYPKMRIAIVSHVRELIRQDYDELMALWPQAPAGIYSAGMGKRDTKSQILFCGIQSVWRRTKEIGSFDLLLIDEAHLIGRKDGSTYRKFIDRLRDEVPDLRIVGLTASAFRLDTGLLHRGKDRVFEDVVYEANVRDLIEQGYLCNLTSKATIQKLDVTGVGKRGGEFIASELELAIDKDWITRAAVDEMMQYGVERKAWLAFCTGVSHALHIRDEIRSRGVSCETITGETPKSERDRIISMFKAGQIRCLTSVMVLATGFNYPGVDMIALLRPTQSAGLFLQQVGRGLRKADGKSDCVVLDFARNILRHGPVDTIRGSERPESGERIMAKECPECATLVALNVMECPCCGHLWPVAEKEDIPKHDAVAESKLTILSCGMQPEWVAVDSMRCFQHCKAGSPPSLRVEYRCGLLVHKQWICFEHEGYAREKARDWWTRHAGTAPPKTVTEALARQDELRVPSEIRVRADGRFFQIVGRRFQVSEPVE